MNTEAIIRQLISMSHSPVRNYATPGLTSELIGGGEHGKVRIFHSDRDTRHFITPHSHRFNFTCLVLRGSVRNILYVRSDPQGPPSNLYSPALLTPVGEGMGKYQLTRTLDAQSYDEVSTVYGAGDTYGMRYHEIHSIYFSKDAEVLFFEGPNVTTETTILEPWSNGDVVPTFESPDWMFLRGDVL
jgi:hypothetical protein